MKINVDFGWKSVNHYGEEVCGDRVQSVRQDKQFIGVLADGMGSGVKANILSTMGSTILSTMVSGGEPLDSAVEVVVRTLPVCSERGMNYCTFSVAQIETNGELHLAEFDNPRAWIVRNHQIVTPDFTMSIVEDKSIRESVLQLVEGDVIVITSDGAVNCGIDNEFSYSWTWDSMASWLCDRVVQFPSARRLAAEVVDMINRLYGERPTDDVTAMVIKIPEKQTVNIMYGPPEYKEDDEFMVREFMDSDGVKIVSGGTTTNIVSRILDSPVETITETAADGVPPISFMAEIDLVTEGLLTMTRTADLMEQCYNNSDFDMTKLDEQNGASILAKQLIENCTELRAFIGRAQNENYDGKDIPMDLNMKMKAIDRICTMLEAQGITVSKFYY